MSHGIEGQMNKVTQIECLGEYRVRAIFKDGMVGEYDFAEVIGRRGPMVEPLRDPEYFRQVFLEDGAPTWPNGYDACPDWLRIEIEKTG
jgi:Protein of unknown function (DUF2442)